ncbi:MAG: hypothetical protein IPH28_01720 [Cytophagaceae bacterium]|nr:hypothetical protein [Cytophagaceae bacterium]MBK9510165.1 hypothetical protein [Cytophagaceae bacterium]MBK9934813.1 hypothetical protein [Cytophagaceae bacterium]MBL0301249.1 hypothetical protein [Cytophagaceae bacterium]MBL0324066.1 hypothetical protein [Cytophagaceae bacterium]
MTVVDFTRNKIIDKLLTIKNQNILDTITEYLNSVAKTTEPLELYDFERKTLEQSHLDNLDGNFKSHKEKEIDAED